MVGFVPIQDQAQPLGILSGFLESGKIPHAMLFTGIDGIGKRAVAKIFAAACNCDRVVSGIVRGTEGDVSAQPDYRGHPPLLTPCGQCRSCRKILSDSHPDIVRVEPDGKLIRIGRIRELLSILAMKPHEASIRVVVISDAQTMNAEAGNALLKILEEPPAGTVLILTACQPADLLPTIVSRCRQIRFNPLSVGRLAAMLIENEGIAPEKAGPLAAMADGSYQRAVTIYRNNGIERRNRLIQVGGFLAGTPSQRVSIPSLMALAFEWVDAKDGLIDALDILTTIYRDLALIKYQRGRLLNEDIEDRLFAAAAKMSELEIVQKLEAIETTRYRLSGNVNPRLATELLLMRLSDFLPGISGKTANA